MSDDGVITDEDIDRARQRIGIPIPSRHPRWNAVPDANTISHYAFGYGDDNPLWHDRSYAENARWRAVTAPPLYLMTTGMCVAPQVPADRKRELLGGLFRGVGKYHMGSSWEWWRPTFADVPIFYDGRTTCDVEVRESEFAGGRAVVETYRTLYFDAARAPVAVHYERFLNAERSGSKAAGKHAGIERQRYSDELLARIEEAYDREVRRGGEKRYWEDVSVGDSVGELVKGPLTTLDVMANHMGRGFGEYAPGPLRIGHRRRRAMPAYYVKDGYGVPDVVQRVHWDPERAQALGLPGPYDYGQMRTAWLMHVVLDWMGDDGWLHKLEDRIVTFNFLGDVQFCRGRVVGKEREGSAHSVVLDLECVNQRGTVTATAVATVLLPSRSSGSIVLPNPPEEFRLLAANLDTVPAWRGVVGGAL